MRRTLPLLGIVLSWLCASQALASPFSLSYGGRLTAGDGSPIAGPVELTIKFFDASTNGNQLGSEVDDQGVVLSSGVFNAPIVLDSSAYTTIFGTGNAVWIEVTDATHGTTYPRQQFSAVPYALFAQHVPVDGTTIGVNGAGQLTLTAAQGTQLGGQPIGGSAPGPGQVLQFNGTEWAPNALPAALSQASASASGFLTSSDWSAFNAKQAALGYAPVNRVGDTMTGNLNMAGGTVTGLGAPINPNDAVTKTYADTINTTLTGSLATVSGAVTALSGAVLKKDGSVPLTSTWNEGTQDITNTGSLVMAGSKVFGLSTGTSDPAGLGPNDTGKIWYNGGIRLWNGTSAQSLGVAGAGLLSLNGQSGNAQTLAIGTAATAPAWSNITANTQTLEIPMANTATVTAGLLSNGDWTTFNAKQPAGSYVAQATAVNTSGPLQGGGALSGNLTLSIVQANGTTNGFLASSDWTTFNSKQPFLTSGNATTPLVYSGGAFSMPAATASASGYLAATDWATFNGKQPAGNYQAAGSYVAQATDVNTTGPLTGGGPLSTSLTIGIPQATVAANGYLASADWATFNAKDPARIIGSLSETGSSILTITGGGGSVIGSGTTLQVAKAANAANGYLGSADWLAFNGKQPLLAQATATVAGYLASSDWATFNGRQAALGYTPVNKGGDTMTGGLTLTAGDIGIGTTTPVEALQVGPASTTATINDTNSSPGGFSNRVGLVGTVTGGQEVSWNATVQDGSRNPVAKFFVTDNVTMGDGAWGLWLGWINNGEQPFVIGSGGFERLRIDNAGNIGMGTTNPAGNLDVENGSNTAQICLNGGCSTEVGGIHGMVVLTSGTSWTIPAGITSIDVTVIGAGGSGGGASTTTIIGGGGGAGGIVESVFTGLTPGTGLSYAIGTGGAAATNANGNNGGNSTITVASTTLTAGGGGGGSMGTESTGATGVGGTGGSASGGQINTVGAPGGGAFQYDDSLSGYGANCGNYGSGGAAAVHTYAGTLGAVAGSNGTGMGAGGSGSIYGGTSGGAANGGLVIRY